MPRPRNHRGGRSAASRDRVWDTRLILTIERLLRAALGLQERVRVIQPLPREVVVLALEEIIESEVWSELSEDE